MSQTQIDLVSTFNKGQHGDLVIYGFFNDFRFLSNFHLVEIPYDGLVFRSTEAAYMSAKTHDQATKIALQGATSPVEAKKLGRQLTLRPDWDSVRLDVMEAVNRVKYITGPSDETKMLGEMLKATKPAVLVEANWWGDRFWGECKGFGENNLGKVLMKIRNEL